MCGITGIWGRAPDGGQGLAATIQSMTGSLHHRGPDGAGVWMDEPAGLALGHSRLAIIDISSAGHQPMLSAGGSLVIVFNGEIYNHQELRSALEAEGAVSVWVGHSDTETLLAAIDHWGVEKTLQLCVGMFAFALWNRATRTLVLARDRFGEKPLYYGWVGHGPRRVLVFGSELKSLTAYPGFDSSICRGALAQYFRFMYVPAPRSIYRGIYKLEPGCLLEVVGAPPELAPEVPLRPGEVHGSMKVWRWWSLAATVEAGSKQPLKDEKEALALLEEQLAEAVRLQSLADVPLGAFLSGGVDSSTIVALMQRQSIQPVKTFTIGFEEAGFDEAPHALSVARHLGTEHQEMLVTAQMSQDVITKLPQIYDEPFADSSQIPTYLVSQAARQHVTVSLSGDAADEFFGGYNRYFWSTRIWNKFAWLPMPIRQAIGKIAMSVPVANWDSLGSPLKMASSIDGVPRLGEKIHKMGERLQTVRNVNDLYYSLVSEWQAPVGLVLGEGGGLLVEPDSLLDDPLPMCGLEKAPLWMMYQDAMTYLPDDILCKVDRAAMASSLETRVPFLDHRLVELAWRLPLDMKIRGNVGKWALREVLYKYVPRELIERPKAGFAIPIGQWLRGPLRDWAEELLAENKLRAEGYLEPQRIRKAWGEHLNGKHDHTHKLWAVLMFQAWLQQQPATLARLAR